MELSLKKAEPPTIVRGRKTDPEMDAFASKVKAEPGVWFNPLTDVPYEDAAKFANRMRRSYDLEAQTRSTGNGNGSVFVKASANGEPAPKRTRK